MSKWWPAGKTTDEEQVDLHSKNGQELLDPVCSEESDQAKEEFQDKKDEVNDASFSGWSKVEDLLQKNFWKAQSPHPAECSKALDEFLDSVFGSSLDEATLQAKDAIRAENKSIDELIEHGATVADLVNMGVPFPQARKFHTALCARKSQAARLLVVEEAPASGQIDELVEERIESRTIGLEKNQTWRGESPVAKGQVKPHEPSGEQEDSLRAPLQEELLLWIQQRGLTCEASFSHQGYIDFACMEELKAQDIEKLGVAEPQASELHDEIRRRRLEDQKLVEEASKARGSRNVQRAVSIASEAWRKSLESWRDQGQHPGENGRPRDLWRRTMDFASLAGNGAVESAQMFMKHISNQAEDFVSARTFGLSFDDALVSSAFRIEGVDGSSYIDCAVAKFSYTLSPSIAIGYALRSGCHLHSFDFLIKAFSESGYLRLGVMQETGCIDLDLDGAFKVGDDERSWAISSGGNLIHSNSSWGPRLKAPLKSGDRVRVIYYEHTGELRFGVNGSMTGVKFNKVAGPLVPCVSASGQTKCVVQLDNYWNY
uniref:B30.2/SPRY domain-containing protein n=2 Tax=Guillardia theta TaxID=55529 RepID=A0A7S4L1T4_GUITH|mmetsp:Transcript_35271/g.110209  ORF Transcript_35271/g.110209 Transcript_35271/m.110209 type:complete len:543 (+) Transcript_35271:58-1686(+)